MTPLKSVFSSQPKYQGYIPHDAVCYHCGRPATCRHHILPAGNRNLSEREGLWVYLCDECHLPPHGIHAHLASRGFSCSDDEHLRWHAQSMWETKYAKRHGCSEAKARMAWRHLTKSPLQSYDYVHEDNHGMWVTQW